MQKLAFRRGDNDTAVEARDVMPFGLAHGERFQAVQRTGGEADVEARHLAVLLETHIVQRKDSSAVAFPRCGVEISAQQRVLNLENINLLPRDDAPESTDGLGAVERKGRDGPPRHAPTDKAHELPGRQGLWQDKGLNRFAEIPELSHVCGIARENQTEHVNLWKCVQPRG